MHAPYSLWAVATFVLLANLPFGYWRANCRKLSFAWFMAIHAPVLLAIAIRLWLGVAFRFSTLPLFVLAFVIGQFLGGCCHPEPAGGRKTYGL
jgi:hypothetical protein